MPLKPGSSKEVISANIKELMKVCTILRLGSRVRLLVRKHSGKRSQKQAVAIALANARKTRKR